MSRAPVTLTPTVLRLKTHTPATPENKANNDARAKRNETRLIPDFSKFNRGGLARASLEKHIHI